MFVCVLPPEVAYLGTETSQRLVPGPIPSEGCGVTTFSFLWVELSRGLNVHLLLCCWFWVVEDIVHSPHFSVDGAEAEGVTNGSEPGPDLHGRGGRWEEGAQRTGRGEGEKEGERDHEGGGRATLQLEGVEGREKEVDPHITKANPQPSKLPQPS